LPIEIIEGDLTALRTSTRSVNGGERGRCSAAGGPDPARSTRAAGRAQLERNAGGQPNR
jgi:hypothetical protein